MYSTQEPTNLIQAHRSTDVTFQLDNFLKIIFDRQQLGGRQKRHINIILIHQ